MSRQFGTESRVTEHGIVLNELGVLRHLAVADGSLVWGVWTGSSDELPVMVPRVSRAATTSNPQYKHLILSTTPAHLWMSCFRLAVLLEDKPGALSALLAVLQEQDVKVHSTECTFSGYNQTRFEALCTHSQPDVQEQIERELRSVEIGDGFAKNRRNKFRVDALETTGYAMMGALARLEAEIILADAERAKNDEDGRFLSRAMVERGSLPWFQNSFMWRRLSNFFECAKRKGIYRFPHDGAEKLASRLLKLHQHLASTTISSPWSERLDYKRSTIAAESEYVRRLQRERETLPDDPPGIERESPANLWIRDYLRRLHMRHWTHPVAATGLTRLAYCGIFRDIEAEPLRFRIERHGQQRSGEWLLRWEGQPGTFLDELSRVNCPSQQESGPDFGLRPVALISIASAGSYARVRFLSTEEVSERTAQFRVDFTVQRKIGVAQEPLAGLVSAVLNGIQAAHGNVERVTSSTLNESSLCIEGWIEVVVIHDWRYPQVNGGGWRAELRSAVSDSLDEHNGGADLITLEIDDPVESVRTSVRPT